MKTTSQHHDIEVLVRLSHEDIRTIRTGLRVLLQIRTREEGYGVIHHALADLPDEENLAQLEEGEELRALAIACREAGLCGEGISLAAKAPEGLPEEEATTSRAGETEA